MLVETTQKNTGSLEPIEETNLKQTKRVNSTVVKTKLKTPQFVILR